MIEFYDDVLICWVIEHNIAIICFYMQPHQAGGSVHFIKTDIPRVRVSGENLILYKNITSVRFVNLALDAKLVIYANVHADWSNNHQHPPFLAYVCARL